METRQGASQPGYSNNLASYHIDYGSLEFGKELGRGGFGIVYEGEYAFGKVAIKKLHPNLLSKEHLKAFEREAEVMTRLRHPHTVQLYGVCLQDPDYALVMEYMPNGSLADLLSSPNHTPWEQRYQIALDVGAGVAYLHQNGIVHCDLKSDNVLLDAHYRAKVTDFGISSLKNENSTFGTWTAGTFGWMAPELMGDDPRNTREADVYAYGVVLWELGARKKPFKGLNVVGIAKRVSEGNREPINEDTPPTMTKLIGDCWKLNPQERPSMPLALKLLKESPVTLSDGWVKLTLEEPSLIQKILSPIRVPQPSELIFHSETFLGAARKGHLATMKWLLNHGSTISEKDCFNWTALHCAARSGHLATVEWLIGQGSSLSDKTVYGYTALHIAAECGHLATVKWLVGQGSSLSEKDNDGNTALHCAAQQGHKAIVEWLLGHGASISEKDKNGRTALLWAASQGYTETVECLLGHGATLSEKDNDGNTALDLASKPELKELLRNYRPPIKLSTHPSRFIGNQSPKPAPQQQSTPNPKKW